jgi:hypothetical protein
MTKSIGKKIAKKIKPNKRWFYFSGLSIEALKQLAPWAILIVELVKLVRMLL